MYFSFLENVQFVLAIIDDDKIHVDVETKKMDDEELLRVIDKVVAKDGNYKKACESILELGIEENPMFRKVYLDYLSEIKDYDYVYRHIEHVTNVKEGILKVMSAEQSNCIAYMREVCHSSELRALNDTFINNMLMKLEKKIK